MRRAPCRYRRSSSTRSSGSLGLLGQIPERPHQFPAETRDLLVVDAGQHRAAAHDDLAVVLPPRGETSCDEDGHVEVAERAESPDEVVAALPLGGDAGGGERVE
jgi:hypothetical protein